MVKKTSFLGRLKDRWKSPAGVKVSTGKPSVAGRAPKAAAHAKPSRPQPGQLQPGQPRSSASTSTSTQTAEAPQKQAPKQPHATANRLAGGAGSYSGGSNPGSYGGGAATDGPALDEGAIDRLPARPMADRSSKRKVSDNEEAVLAVREGFQELASLMRGMQARGDAQGDQLAIAVDQLKQLPGLAGQQLNTLGQIAAGLERQGAAQEELAKSLSGVPEVMRGVEKALVDAAARDERTAQTLGDFRGTMTRMQDAMGEMVTQSKRQADSSERQASNTARIAERDSEGLQKQNEAHHKELLGSIHGLGSAQADAVTGLKDTQKEVIEDLRRAQYDQARKLEAAVENAGRWNQALLVVLLLVFGGLATVLAVVLAS